MNNTLDKWDVQSILHQLQLLDRTFAFLQTAFPNTTPSAQNGQRMVTDIRNKILDVAIITVGVEPVEQSPEAA